MGRRSLHRQSVARIRIYDINGDLLDVITLNDKGAIEKSTKHMMKASIGPKVPELAPVEPEIVPPPAQGPIISTSFADVFEQLELVPDRYPSGLLGFDEEQDLSVGELTVPDVFQMGLIDL